MIRKSFRNLLYSAAMCGFSVTCAAAAPQAMQPAPPALHNAIIADLHHSVGKSLPHGISVLDAHGKKVDLRDALEPLHGRVILAVVGSSGCSPCQNLVKYAKKPRKHANGTPVHWVFLRIHDNNQPPLQLPSSILVLHTPDALDTGFMAVHIPLEGFYFDASRKLVARVVGVRDGEPAEFFDYPTTTPDRQSQAK